MARRSPSVVLYRLGADPALRPVPRVAARWLSVYERAFVRSCAEAVLEPWWMPDWPLLLPARWAALKLAGERAAVWREAPSLLLPYSGWRGNVLVLAIWGSAAATLATLVL